MFEEAYQLRGEPQCQAVENSLSKLQSAIPSLNSEVLMACYLEVAYLLGKDICVKIVWEWLGRRAETALETEKIAMRIAILELLPEEPKSERDLELLWKNWLSPSRRWMVEAAYNTVPEDMEQDRLAYAQPLNGRVEGID